MDDTPPPPSAVSPTERDALAGTEGVRGQGGIAGTGGRDEIALSHARDRWRRWWRRRRPGRFPGGSVTHARKYRPGGHERALRSKSYSSRARHRTAAMRGGDARVGGRGVGWGGEEGHRLETPRPPCRHRKCAPTITTTVDRTRSSAHRRTSWPLRCTPKPEHSDRLSSRCHRGTASWIRPRQCGCSSP